MKLNIPTLKEPIAVCDYTKPIPPLPDNYLQWPGKSDGKPKPPIMWIEDIPKRLEYKGPCVYRINENISYGLEATITTAKSPD